MMKARNIFPIFLTIMILTTLQVNASYIIPEEEEAIDTTKYEVYNGKIYDVETNIPLPFATVETEEMNLSTVSNIDGEFTLKIPLGSSVSEVKVSYIGYKNQLITLNELGNKNNIQIGMEPSMVELDEVTIRIEDASNLISAILDNIRKNYSNEDMMMRAFYRETTKKRRNYISISEAVVDIYKAPYDNGFASDQMKLVQGRKSADVEKMDTVLFKVQGGPILTLMLDVVKNPSILLTEYYKDIYNFYISGIISINDRLHYIVSFDQLPHVETPLYHGKLYVDMDKLAISEAEFELNMENQMEVASMFVKKKPIGMSVIPEKAAYRAKYTIEDGDKWYFSYARGEVKFDVAWKKKLFNTSYTTMSEIAITDRSEDAAKIPSSDRFKRSFVMDELVYVFFDQDFWQGYNVIEPDQSIENAIKRLNRRFLRNESD